MADLSNEVIAQFVIIAGIVAAYREAFGLQQSEFTEVVVKAFAVKSRYKPAANVATSVLVAIAIGAVIAHAAGAWEVLPISAIAGLYASTKAAAVHDEKKVIALEAQQEAAPPAQRPLVSDYRRLP